MSKRLQYWDSCMFIAILANRPNEKDRIEVIRHLLQEEKQGNIAIVASTLCIAEVRPDENNPMLNQVEFDMAIELMRSDRIDWRPLTPYIAEEAQRIGKQYPGITPTIVSISRPLSLLKESKSSLPSMVQAAGARTTR